MEIVANSTESVRAADKSWQIIYSAAFRSPAELHQILKLPVSMANHASDAEKSFPLFCPEPYLQRIEKGNPNDPLLLQVWPSPEETESLDRRPDPLQETEFEIVPGLLKKYGSRALLVATGSCAIHCRYCFRRHFPYHESPKSLDQWKPALDAIGQDPTIEEIILSGGDPLSLSDRKIGILIKQLADIRHVQRLRIHTRLPVVIPQRVTDSLMQLLEATRLATVIVLHCNHANEIDDAVSTAATRLIGCGATLLNQAVLLRNVNDRLDALIELSRRLLDCRIVPYYLHQLDPVAGTTHFEVPAVEGRELIRRMRASVSGYLVPRYVQEIPHRDSKTILA